jgi:site-specific DNA recombinase
VPPQAPQPKRAIIYARQSKDSEDGIDRQIEKCLRLIADRGWELVHAPFTDNDVSASKKRKRPAYEAAMAMVKASRCDVLVVAHMDRLYRRTAELEDIIPIVEKTGVLVVSTDGAYDLSTANGRMVARMLCAASQGEIEVKSRRYRDAAAQDAKQGRRNQTGPRPFGYCADRITPMEAGIDRTLLTRPPVPAIDGPGLGSAEPWTEVTARVAETQYSPAGEVLWTESEADAYRDAMDFIRRGGSVAGIVRKWDSWPLRPHLAPYGPLRHGNPWTHASVLKILTNPHSAGLRAYDGIIVADGDWTPLVTVEKWQAVQDVLTNPDRKPSRGMTSLLGGIAECRCGLPVRHATRSRGSGQTYGRYTCISYQPDRETRPGPHTTLQSEPIDRFVTEVLIESLERPDAAQLFARDEDTVDVPALKARLKELDDAVAKLSWQNSTGVLPDSVFMSNASRIAVEREEVTVAIAEAGRTVPAARLLAASDVRGEWKHMDISERRSVIRSLMRITLREAGKGCRNPDYSWLTRIAWKIPAAT